MATSGKPFDAVRMMCLIRDRLCEQIGGMTFEEAQACIRRRFRDGPADGNAAAELEDAVQNRSTVESGG